MAAPRRAATCLRRRPARRIRDQLGRGSEPELAFDVQPRCSDGLAADVQPGADLLNRTPLVARSFCHDLIFAAASRCELRDVRDRRRGDFIERVAGEERLVAGDQHVRKSEQAGEDIVAVNCAVAGGTCFCVSMKAGPKAESGFDLALTEIIGQGRHYFVVEAGTEIGGRVLAETVHRPVDADEQTAAGRVVENTAGSMGRSLDTNGIKELLHANLDHPSWDEVASRRLTCACFVAPAVTVPRSIAQGDSRRHCSADFWADSTS